MGHRIVSLLAGVVALAASAGAQLCPEWGEGVQVGVLDGAVLPEASGLAASRRYPGRLYHVNDSGNPPMLFLSDSRGGSLTQTGLSAAGLKDPEDLAIGPCGGAADRDCIFVGDIGDNGRRRPEIIVLVVPELEQFPAEAAALKRLRLRYPDGPHDAESLAVHPGTGDIFILAKEMALLPGHGRSARLYRLPSEAWRTARTAPLTLEAYGELDLPALAIREGATFSHVATAMDISPDGKRLLILTYDHAWELAWDLADGPPPPTEELRRGVGYGLVQLAPMLGKETIAWLPDGESFLFGKELKPDSQPSVLIRHDCSSR